MESPQFVFIIHWLQQPNFCHFYSLMSSGDLVGGVHGERWARTVSPPPVYRAGGSWREEEDRDSALPPIVQGPQEGGVGDGHIPQPMIRTQ